MTLQQAQLVALLPARAKRRAGIALGACLFLVTSLQQMVRQLVLQQSRTPQQVTTMCGTHESSGTMRGTHEVHSHDLQLICTNR
jgi:hypothetical protein